MDFAKLDLSDHQELARIIIKKAAGKKFKNRRAFEKFRNGIIKEHKSVVFHNLYFVKAYNDLLKDGEINVNENLLSLIQKRKVRTLSGVAPVTVLTKPFPCPGKCIYCPTDVRMPKSYLPSQPAAQRGFRQQFNPYTQVFVRLKALAMTGHQISKVELRILGGTWSSYPKRYQTWFVKKCIQAMNEFKAQISDEKTDKMENIIEKNVVSSPYGKDEINTVVLNSIKKGNLKFADVVKENETAKVRCIGINVETRPDHIDEEEVRRLRKLGVTKIEIGVQTTDDKVQEITERGHDLASVRKATRLLKDAGFKLSYHMMPNLPGSTIEKDSKMIGELFEGDEYQPDYLKLYPCMVVPKSKLAIIYRKGGFEPYNDEILQEILYQNLKDVPEWCRVDRVARDIPAPDIEAGTKFSNVRQILEKRMNDEGVRIREIRYREIKDADVNIDDIEFVVRKYNAGGGVEYFLSYEDVKNDKLIALLRLRFPRKTFIKELNGASLIREVHVYGKQIAVGKKLKGENQHMGWGSRLMKKAEEISLGSDYKKIAVIAGIGTREYYAKKGYSLDGTYMCKKLA